ncbi:MAG: carbohydrate ABC transporter permease [Clostridiales bacterium]|nr:carbohydrate ABC transporter permease [Clostridiales bacterium]
MTGIIETKERSRHGSYKAKKILFRTLLYLLLAVIAVVMIVPFYWSVLISFRPSDLIVSYPIKLYPSGFTREHYTTFFAFGAFRYIGNTLIVIAAILITQLLFCSMAGYSLARLKYKGKGFILKFFMATMMIPGIISLIPSYIVVSALGGLDSLWGIIAPATYSIYGCLFMRSFFLGTPPEIAEAARIDGANEFRIFLQLYVPMVLPGFMTLALFTFNASWNNYLWPSLILPTMESTYGTVAIALKSFEGAYGDDQGAVMAGAIVTVLPSILIFVCGQKYFLENLAFAGIK